MKIFHAIEGRSNNNKAEQEKTVEHTILKLLSRSNTAASSLAFLQKAIADKNAADAQKDKSKPLKWSPLEGGAPMSAPEVRENMVKFIELRLRDCKQLPSQINIKCLAKRLEEIMFRKASSFEEYQDESTLKTRFQKLLGSALHRCLNKAEKSQTQIKIRRRTALIAAVGGQEKYQEILRLTRLMTQLRNTVLAKCAATTELSSLPQPAKDLLFRSSLMHTLEITPMDRLTSLNWTAIVQENRDIVHKYCAWHTHSTANVALAVHV